LSEDAGAGNSASGVPGGPRRTDGQVGVEISAGEMAGWDAESMGSRVEIVKTTVVSAEWEDVHGERGEASGKASSEGNVVGVVVGVGRGER
jgi:hypothetical protein